MVLHERLGNLSKMLPGTTSIEKVKGIVRGRRQEISPRHLRSITRRSPSLEVGYISFIEMIYVFPSCYRWSHSHVLIHARQALYHCVVFPVLFCCSYHFIGSFASSLMISHMRTKCFGCIHPYFPLLLPVPLLMISSHLCVVF